MVRIFILLLNLLYTFSATGAIVYLHYCCGEPQRLAMEQLTPAENGDCPMCTTHQEPRADMQGTPHHGCEQEHAGNTHDDCYDVKVALKKTTETHVVSAEKNIFKGYPLGLVVFSLIGMVPSVADQATPDAADRSLSPPTAVPLFIQHCAYRI